MDRVFSARVDESIIYRIDSLARRLRMTKKAIIENAILLYAERVESENDIDVLEQTLGAWRRDESPPETIEKARDAFNASMGRYKR